MIQSGDFVKLNYTGKLSDGTIFDTTDAAIAARAGFEGKTFKPAVICVGQKMLVSGLDAALIGKGVGPFKISLSHNQAFGAKDPKLVKIVPVTQLHAQKIQPHPGLKLNIDGKYGVVRSVNSGRAVVDFNHPLASQDITYEVDVLAIIEELNMQVRSLIEAAGLPYKDIKVENNHVIVVFNQMLPKPILDILTHQITTLTNCKTVSYESGEKPKK